MRVTDLTAGALRTRLAGPGLALRTGPFVTNVQSRVDAVIDGIALHYADHPVDDAGFVDFHVGVQRPRSLRRWFRPQVMFSIDGASPFNALPGDQGFALLEWGLNWCISAHCHQYLIAHAAVVERAGGALVMPAPSGSGKSTLCAALSLGGWRLLSDELAMFDPTTRGLVPLVRPVSLKNASIDVIRRFAPDATFSTPIHDTVKGTVAHVKPPLAAVLAASQQAKPRWIVSPRFEPGAGTALSPLSRGRALMMLADNAFNYSVHGLEGFELLAAVVESCECFELCYSDLQDAVNTLTTVCDRGIATCT